MSKLTALQDEADLPAPPAGQRAARRRAKSADRTKSVPAVETNPRSWLTSTFALGLAGGLLLCAALPPLNFWPLAWIAPLPWLAIVKREKLAGRRPYVALWIAGLIHWLLLLQGLHHAHPALYVGWGALSGYLAVYLPLFVGLSRIAVHRLRVPLVVAAPIVWTGLELARGHLITGFSMALLGHTQVDQTWLIQIADAFGAYGVSFLVMLGAACVLESLPLKFDRDGRTPRWKLRPLAIALLTVLAAAGYGWSKLRAQQQSGPPQQAIRVALVQESIDTIFEHNPERDVRTYEKYLQQTLRAIEQHGPVDLVVWPESMLAMPDVEMQMTVPEILIDGEIAAPDDFPDPQMYRDNVIAVESIFRGRALETLEQINRAKGSGDRPVYLLGGGQVWRFGPEGRQVFNSATLLNPQAVSTARYFKTHPVMFGEYIPLGDVFPLIYDLSPMEHGLTPGDGPKSMDVAGIRISPSICFESTVPHLIRTHTAELQGRGENPDVLINLTNDGWFFGSAILDLQLNCAVFRAVENRRPVLVAANTGISAWIDAAGEIRARSPRRTPDAIVAEISPHEELTWYGWWGDAPAGLCLALTLFVGLVGLWRHRATQRDPGGEYSTP